VSPRINQKIECFVNRAMEAGAPLWVATQSL